VELPGVPLELVPRLPEATGITFKGTGLPLEATELPLDDLGLPLLGVEPLLRSECRVNPLAGGVSTRAAGLSNVR
jgi:hypothetical protein